VFSMAKKVLVLGSTGAMGQYLVPYLCEKGYQVTAVSLDNEIPYNNQVTCIKGDAKDVSFLTSLLSQNFDGVVDFMIYGKQDFPDYYRYFLDHTGHYIFLSSCRVYANEEWPIKETSPRLLDVSTDAALLASNDYCMHKAKSEDLLRASEYANWTIVRPSTTYASVHSQLLTLDWQHWLPRARSGEPVLLYEAAKDIPASLTWGGDVAEMIARLLFLPDALRETYNVATAEHRTWAEIADYYKDICGLESVWVDKEDYLKILDPEVSNGTRWQLEYARLFDRITDNAKVLAATGLKQDDLIPLYDGLKLEV